MKKGTAMQFHIDVLFQKMSAICSTLWAESIVGTKMPTTNNNFMNMFFITPCYFMFGCSKP